MYFLLGLSLFFTLLLALNFLISLAASAVWRVIEKPAQNWSAQRRTQTIFALRIFPLLIAVISVFAFLLPSYLLFEPQSSDENVSLKMAVLTAISLVGIAAALFRVFKTWRRTQRLVREWMKFSEPITVENLDVPVYKIRHPFPVIAVVGAFRAKMFVAEQVFASLDENELRAAIAHECGHLATKDNLKRTLLRICRDLLVFSTGKSLDEAWAENAESAADEYAAQNGDQETALNLAAALVKIAKIVPPETSPAMPLGAFLIEENYADITGRVRRLVYLAGNPNSFRNSSLRNLRLGLAISCVFLFLSIFALATDYGFLFQIHALLEKFVAILQ